MCKRDHTFPKQFDSESSGTTGVCMWLLRDHSTVLKLLSQRDFFLILVFIWSVWQWSGRPGFNPSRVIPKTPKMVLYASLHNTQYYKVWINGKWSNPGKGVASSPTLWCSNYWKEVLQVTLNYDLSTNSFFHLSLFYIIFLSNISGLQSQISFRDSGLFRDSNSLKYLKIINIKK